MTETPQQPSTCRAGRRRVEQTLIQQLREPHTSSVHYQPQLPAHPQPAGEALSFCYKSFHSVRADRDSAAAPGQMVGAGEHISCGR
jgi:hypothetical protein